MNQPVRIPESKRWAYELVAAADAGMYASRSALPLQWARQVVEQEEARQGRAAPVNRETHQ